MSDLCVFKLSRKFLKRFVEWIFGKICRSEVLKFFFFLPVSFFFNISCNPMGQICLKMQIFVLFWPIFSTFLQFCPNGKRCKAIQVVNLQNLKGFDHGWRIKPWFCLNRRVRTSTEFLEPSLSWNLQSFGEF